MLSLCCVLQLKLRVAPLTRAVAEVRVITKKPAFSDSEDEGEGIEHSHLRTLCLLAI